MRQPVQGSDYGVQAPRPYAWKTDEFQTQAEARKTGGNSPLAVTDPRFIAGNYRCPNCMSQFLPRIEKRISTMGWVVFAVLLVVFFPLFWIGLLIKEEVQVCPSCAVRVK